MYCNKCGKFIEYEGFICKECQQKEQPATELEKPENNQQPEQVQVAVVQPAVSQPNPMLLGFKKALVSAILPEIALVVAIIGIEMLILNIGFMIGSPELFSVPLIFLGCVILLGAFAMFVVAVVLGIQSINVAKRAVAEGKRRPIPTFILGIVGTAMGITVFFYLALFAFVFIGTSFVWGV